MPFTLPNGTRAGIITHSDAFIQFALPPTLSTLSPDSVAQMLVIAPPITPQQAAQDVANYIQQNNISLLLLEANLGDPNGGPVFNETFFADHPDTQFALYSGATLGGQNGDPHGAIVGLPADAPAPDNVLGWWVKSDVGMNQAVQQAIVQQVMEPVADEPEPNAPNPLAKNQPGGDNDDPNVPTDPDEDPDDGNPEVPQEHGA